MERLFFELLQVSTGRLDCFDRGPSPEEWQRLYELSKAQDVEGICYHGVELLFEFGLRAPQDVSIDWMAESELIREKNEQVESLPPVTDYYPEELRLLRQLGPDGVSPVKAPLTIQDVYEAFRQHRMDMRLLMDYCFCLRKTGGRHETMRHDGLMAAVKGRIGIGRFARGVMWVLQESLALEHESMPWEPLEQEGRFLLSEMTQEHRWWQRTGHSLKYLQAL